MVIRSSQSPQIERLVDDLRGPAARRDAAVARLRIIGPRAVERVAALVASDAPPAARAAIGALRGRLTGESGTEVLDLISSIALDTERAKEVRLAALDALSELPRHVVQPLLQQAGIGDGSPATKPGPAAFDDPTATTEWIAANAAAPMSVLHDLVLDLRERERREPSARSRQRWALARGAVHAVLARRGSRVALYDIRESFDAAHEPLPLDFLAAATTLGDAATLEPLARAWTAAAARETWWRDRLRDAAADISRREKLSGRSALVKRIRARWPGFLI